MTNDDERAAFEADIGFTPNRFPDDDTELAGHYMSVSVHLRWLTWQAAIALEREACAVLVDPMTRRKSATASELAAAIRELPGKGE